MSIYFMVSLEVGASYTLAPVFIRLMAWIYVPREERRLVLHLVVVGWLVLFLSENRNMTIWRERIQVTAEGILMRNLTTADSKRPTILWEDVICHRILFNPSSSFPNINNTAYERHDFWIIEDSHFAHFQSQISQLCATVFDKLNNG